MILRDPAVARLRQIYRPASGRLWWAAVLGALALGSSVALMAASAWLISRAWERPPILFLQVAVVSVRAFGIGRGVIPDGLDDGEIRSLWRANWLLSDSLCIQKSHWDYFN